MNLAAAVFGLIGLVLGGGAAVMLARTVRAAHPATTAGGAS